MSIFVLVLLSSWASVFSASNAIGDFIVSKNEEIWVVESYYMLCLRQTLHDPSKAETMISLLWQHYYELNSTMSNDASKHATLITHQNRRQLEPRRLFLKKLGRLLHSMCAKYAANPLTCVQLLALFPGTQDMPSLVGEMGVLRQLPRLGMSFVSLSFARSDAILRCLQHCRAMQYMLVTDRAWYQQAENGKIAQRQRSRIELAFRLYSTIAHLDGSAAEIVQNRPLDLLTVQFSLYLLFIRVRARLL
jgi:hypothetical protein